LVSFFCDYQISLSFCQLTCLSLIMSVFLCQRLNMLSCPAFFVQCSAADICCTFLFAFSAQSLNSVAVLSVTPAAVMTMVNFCFVCYKCCSDDHGSYCLPSIMCAGDGAGGRTKPVKSVVYTTHPSWSLVPQLMLPSFLPSLRQQKTSSSPSLPPSLPQQKTPTLPSLPQQPTPRLLLLPAGLPPSLPRLLMASTLALLTRQPLSLTVQWTSRLMGGQLVSPLQRWASGLQSSLGSTFLLSGPPPSLLAPPQSSLPPVKLLGSSP